MADNLLNIILLVFAIVWILVGIAQTNWLGRLLFFGLAIYNIYLALFVP